MGAQVASFLRTYELLSTKTTDANTTAGKLVWTDRAVVQARIGADILITHFVPP